jgi:hypothetical protein
MTRRFHVVVVSLVCALFVAGCGGRTKSGVSGEAGAALVRSGALAYLAVDSDLGSNQWQKVDDLLHKFPGREKWLRALRRQLAQVGLEYGRDVKPGLGPEVDIAVVAGASPHDISYAWLTKPESVDKAKALARKLGETSSPPEQTVTRVVHGWVVVSDSAAKIDSTLKSGSQRSLADDAAFKEAIAKPPDDALAKAYVNGRRFADLIEAYLGAGAQTTAFGGSGLAPFGLAKVDWIAADLDAEDEGIHFEADVKGAGGRRLLGADRAYASKLISGVPADALVFASFRGGPLADQLRELRKNPEFGPGFGELERMLGLRLADLLSLFRNEVAFYVRRGPGLPEFSLALDTPDEARALATLDRLVAHVARLTGSRVSTEKQGGVRVKSIGLGRVTVHYAAFDGRVLVTTGPTGIADYRASGDKLSDASAYENARSGADVPDKTAGLLYVNLRDGVRLIEDYVGLAAGERVPAEVRENLKPLQSFVAFSTASGDVASVSAFLAIK